MGRQYHNNVRTGTTPRLSNRKLVAELQRMTALAQSTNMVLLAVLAQNGNVTVTQGTIDQVGQNLAQLDWAITDNGNPNESLVRLVDRSVKRTRDCVITKIEDDEVSTEASTEVNTEVEVSTEVGS